MNNKFPSILAAIFIGIALGALWGAVGAKVFSASDADTAPSMQWAKIVWHEDVVYYSPSLGGYIMPDSDYQSWDVVQTTRYSPSPEWDYIDMLNVYTKSSNVPTAGYVIHRYRVEEMEDDAGPED